MTQDKAVDARAELLDFFPPPPTFPCEHGTMARTFAVQVFPVAMVGEEMTMSAVFFSILSYLF